MYLNNNLNHVLKPNIEMDTKLCKKYLHQINCKRWLADNSSSSTSKIPDQTSKPSIKNPSSLKTVNESFKEDPEEDQEVSPDRTGDKGFIFEIPFLMTLTGKKKSGKSTFMKQFLTTNSDRFDEIFIISGTAEITKEFESIDNLKVLGNIDNDELERLMSEKTDEHTLLIFDDWIGVIKLRTAIMRRLVSSARHVKVSMMIATQKFMQLPPIMRTNSEYAIFFNQPKSEVKKIYDEYGDSVTKSTFITSFAKIVRNKGWGLMYDLDKLMWFLIHIEEFIEPPEIDLDEFEDEISELEI